jgi:hypothetical protein
MKIYPYTNYLFDNQVLDTLLGELINKGHNVPNSSYDLLEIEPFKTILENTPTQYGRRKSPFEKAAQHCDGLLLDLTLLQGYDPFVIEVGCGLMTSGSIKEGRTKYPVDRIIDKGTLHFIKSHGDASRLESDYIVYTKSKA